MRYRVTVTSKTAFAIAVRQWRTQDFILDGIDLHKILPVTAYDISKITSHVTNSTY